MGKGGGGVRMWGLGRPGQKQRCLPLPQVGRQALPDWAQQDLGTEGNVPLASHFSAAHADT